MTMGRRRRRHRVQIRQRFIVVVRRFFFFIVLFVLFIVDGKQNENPYAVLRVSPRSTLPQIKAAYRKAAKRVHPDRVHDPERKRRAEKEFVRLNDAYETILRYREKPQETRSHDESGRYSRHDPDARREQMFREFLKSRRKRREYTYDVRIDEGTFSIGVAMFSIVVVVATTLALRYCASGVARRTNPPRSVSRKDADQEGGLEELNEMLITTSRKFVVTCVCTSRSLKNTYEKIFRLLRRRFHDSDPVIFTKPYERRGGTRPRWTERVSKIIEVESKNAELSTPDVCCIIFRSGGRRYAYRPFDSSSILPEEALARVSVWVQQVCIDGTARCRALTS